MNSAELNEAIRDIENEKAEESLTVIACQLDKSECDHDFTQTGDAYEDHCTKCGQSVMGWAMMEMP